VYECPTNPPERNSTGTEVPYNEFYQVELFRDLAFDIVNKYKGNNPCPNFKLIIYWIKNHIRYMTDMKQFGVVDYWLFPNETILTGAEDCDGMSFLLATMLEALGYATRVAMGRTPWGYHMWVEFEDDQGSELIVEATMGIIYPYAEGVARGYAADIYINPNGCYVPMVDVESY